MGRREGRKRKKVRWLPVVICGLIEQLSLMSLKPLMALCSSGMPQTASHQILQTKSPNP